MSKEAEDIYDLSMRIGAIAIECDRRHDMGSIMCECCKINKARFKDYREVVNRGYTQKFFVCSLCCNLTDGDFFAIYEGDDSVKRRVICEIVNEWRLRDFTGSIPQHREDIGGWISFLEG